MTQKPISLAFWSALLFFGIVLLFAPIDVFVHNSSDFGAAWRIWPQLFDFVVAFVIAATCAVAVAWALPRRISWAFTGLLVWLAVGAYVQAFVVNWSYGPLTGEQIDWNAFTLRGWIDVLIWMMLAAFVAVALRRRPRDAVVPLAILFLLQGGLAAARLPWHTINEAVKAEAPEERLRAAARFSREGNILFIILDAVQNDIAAEILSDRPELRRAFDGFTFYSNVSANFTTTEFSVGAMLSGVPWDQSVPQKEYFSKIYNKNSVIREAVASSYDVTFYSSKIQYCETIESALDCKLYGRLISGGMLELLRYQLLDIALFRISPQFLKKAIFFKGKWLFSDVVGRSSASLHKVEVEIAKKLRSSLQAIDGPRTFKVFHFLLTHGPIRLDEQCNWGIFETTRATYKMQDICGMSLVAEILGKMRAVGVYDNSMIIIAADHGNGHPIHGAPLTGIGNFEMKDAIPQIAKNVPGTAYPMLLVKRPGAAGALKVSAVPVMSSDIAGLLCEAIKNCDVGRYGKFGDVSPDRSRVYSYYDFREIKEDDPFFAPMTLFKIRGPIHEAASWHFIGPRVPRTEAAGNSSR